MIEKSIFHQIIPPWVLIYILEALKIFSAGKEKGEDAHSEQVHLQRSRRQARLRHWRSESGNGKRGLSLSQLLNF